MSVKNNSVMAIELEPLETETRVVARRPGMFRALSHRNYRIFWIGAFLSNAGTWMQAVAQGWLVLQLTNSALWLGIDGFMATVPGFFLTLAHRKGKLRSTAARTAAGRS